MHTHNNNGVRVSACKVNNVRLRTRRKSTLLQYIWYRSLFPTGYMANYGSHWVQVQWHFIAAILSVPHTVRPMAHSTSSEFIEWFMACIFVVTYRWTSTKIAIRLNNCTIPKCVLLYFRSLYIYCCSDKFLNNGSTLKSKQYQSQTERNDSKRNRLDYTG